MRASIIELRVLGQIRLIGPLLHLFALLTKQGPRKVAKSRDRRSSTTYTELPAAQMSVAVQRYKTVLFQLSTQPHRLKLGRITPLSSNRVQWYSRVADSGATKSDLATAKMRRFQRTLPASVLIEILLDQKQFCTPKAVRTLFEYFRRGKTVTAQKQVENRIVVEETLPQSTFAVAAAHPIENSWHKQYAQ